jgi:hypothetical protein
MQLGGEMVSTHVWAKIAGWAQFALQLFGQVTSGAPPHGVMGWLTLAGSLLAAVGIHASSNTDGTK